MKVIALHGDYAKPADLRRDMGDPDWVDWYPAGHDAVNIRNLINSSGWQNEPLVLMGYSKGGSVVGDLSHILDNIVGAVLYESPLMSPEDPGGTFPVLWIRNNYQPAVGRAFELWQTYCAWAENHPITKMTGQGRHIRWRFGWPPFGHNWDNSLNGHIERFVKEVGRE